jgi:hypothetical protein
MAPFITMPSPGVALTRSIARSADAHLGARAPAGGLTPARSPDEAQADPRFFEGARRYLRLLRSQDGLRGSLPASCAA